MTLKQRLRLLKKIQKCYSDVYDQYMPTLWYAINYGFQSDTNCLNYKYILKDLIKYEYKNSNLLIFEQLVGKKIKQLIHELETEIATTKKSIKIFRNN